MKLWKRVFLTLLFPILMFLVMLLITASSEIAHVNGHFIFLDVDIINFVIRDTCLTVSMALAIWLQIKNGRFDFSIGSSMILTAIIAGNIGSDMRSPFLTLAVAALCGVVLNVINGLLYVYGRMPIIISSIAITLLYESLTYLVFGGSGISNYYADTTMNIFGRMPAIFIPTVLAVIVFVVFDSFSVAGRKGKILSNNQGAGVNIGINEKKNVLVSYIYTGVIIGMASVIYVSQNFIATQSGLASTGIMFSYIAPVFMGMIVGKVSKDVIGIIVSSIAIAIMSYGLNCLNLGAGGWQNIIFGVFVMGFYGVSSRMDLIKALFRRKKADV